MIIGYGDSIRDDYPDIVSDWSDNRVFDFREFASQIKSQKKITGDIVYDLVITSSKKAVDWTKRVTIITNTLTTQLPIDVTNKWMNVFAFNRMLTGLHGKKFVVLGELNGHRPDLSSMWDLSHLYSPIALHENLHIQVYPNKPVMRGVRQHEDVFVSGINYTLKCCEHCSRLCASQTTCCKTVMCNHCELDVLHDALWKCPFCSRACSRNYSPLLYDGNRNQLEISSSESPGKIAADMELIEELNKCKSLLKHIVEELGEC
jgi:hypothetical protein